MSYPQRLALASLLLGVTFQPDLHAANGVKNVIVYRESGRYAGWPANHGIWSWGNEIVVGFESGYFHYSETRHSIDWDRPAQHLLARSKDGGETWSIEHPESLKPPPNAMVKEMMSRSTSISPAKGGPQISASTPTCTLTRVLVNQRSIVKLAPRSIEAEI